MDKYDELFDATAPTGTIFADKGALDPLADPAEIHARDAQERALATILNGVGEGYLPATVSIYGPPGTGKTLTTRRLCRAFAARHDAVAVEYVNLKECRTIFSAANEILVELTGEKKGAYAGLDGVFEGIWEALESYPAWTVLILDEIDHIRHDTNYDPSDFFYRLLRGEGKLERDVGLSVWLVSNELLDVDLRLDSRVESAMSDEAVFFPPYDADALDELLAPRFERAFHDGVLADEVRAYGVGEAARRWGDARKALTLFRRAGETAAEGETERITRDCLDANLETTEREATIGKLAHLPAHHLLVLEAITAWVKHNTGEIQLPVTTSKVHEAYNAMGLDDAALGERAVRKIIADLETMGLVETWIESKGREGRQKRIETTFDPTWVADAQTEYRNRHTPDREEPPDEGEP